VRWETSRLLIFTRRFDTLRWRLILACFVAAFSAMLTLEGMFVVVPGVVAMATPQRPVALVQGLQKLAPQVAPHLRQSPPDRAQLEAALKTYKQPIFIAEGLTENLHTGASINPGENAALSVVGRDGGALAALTPSGGSSLERARQSSAATTVIAAALRNDTQTSDLIQTTSDGLTVAAAPIVDSDGVLRGALFMSVDLISLLRPAYLLNLLALIPTVFLFAFIASVVGAIFGALTARGLTRRMLRLTSAANAWSRGDFTVSAHDTSRDELGQLAHDLNRMAEQIQTLLAERRDFAVMEERNRLARDLHDSVKQEVFAASMQVAAARALVRRDPSAAEERLGGMERLLGQAKRDLATLIQELRPVALDGKGLAAALRDYCADWSHDSGVSAAVRTQGEQPLPWDVEQALFRVTQEALANVMRHSGATEVEVNVHWEPEALTLSVTDNGRGFDLAAVDGKGVGLRSMEERLAAVGGALSIYRAAGAGTTIEACVPLHGQPAPTAPAIGLAAEGERAEKERLGL
jgi:NarL family two-component system sensor histidine kinase LiaS